MNRKDFTFSDQQEYHKWILALIWDNRLKHKEKSEIEWLIFCIYIYHPHTKKDKQKHKITTYP